MFFPAVSLKQLAQKYLKIPQNIPTNAVRPALFDTKNIALCFFSTCVVPGRKSLEEASSLCGAFASRSWTRTRQHRCCTKQNHHSTSGKKTFGPGAAELLWGSLIMMWRCGVGVKNALNFVVIYSWFVRTLFLFHVVCLKKIKASVKKRLIFVSGGKAVY